MATHNIDHIAANGMRLDHCGDREMAPVQSPETTAANIE